MANQRPPLKIRVRGLAVLAGLGLLAACTNTPQAPEAPGTPGQQAQAQARDCLPSQPRLGTTIVRREDCQPAATPEEREAARQRAQALRDEQQRNRPSRGPGG